MYYEFQLSMVLTTIVKIWWVLWAIVTWLDGSLCPATLIANTESKGPALPQRREASYANGLVQERRNSIANALELRLFCTNPSIRWGRSAAETMTNCAQCARTSNGSWCMGIKGEMSGTVCVTFTWYMYIYELFIAFVCFVVCSLL